MKTASAVRTLQKTVLSALVPVWFGIAGCQAEPAAIECPPPPKPKPVMEVTPLKIPHGADEDFCNACVKAPAGFVSCQRVYQLEKGEERQQIRSRAIEKACKDAGYPADKCPSVALVGVQCKGDSANPGGLTAGQALQVISGRPTGKDAASAQGKDAEPASKSAEKKAPETSGKPAAPIID